MANLRTFLGLGNFHTDFDAFEHFFGLSSLQKGVFSSTELLPYSMQHITMAIFLVILRNSAFPSDKPNLPFDARTKFNPEITKPLDFFHFSSKSRRNFELFKLPSNFYSRAEKKRVAQPFSLLTRGNGSPVVGPCRRNRENIHGNRGSALLLLVPLRCSIMVVCE